MPPTLLPLAAESVPAWAENLVHWSDLVSGVLGLFIAYQAYRGYRRNRSRPMLFVSLGFVLALGVPFAALVVVNLVPLSLPDPVVLAIGLLMQASEILGLACIVYGLWMRP